MSAPTLCSTTPSSSSSSWHSMSLEDMRQKRRQILWSLLRTLPFQTAVRSYNHFLKVDLIPIVEECYGLLQTVVDDISIQYQVSGVYYEAAPEVEHVDVEKLSHANGVLLCRILARQVTCYIKKQEEVLYERMEKELLLFELPAMIGSVVGPTHYPPLYEGTFSVRGNMRVFVGHNRSAHNSIILESQHGLHTMSYRAEVYQQRYCSTNTLTLKMRTNYSLRWASQNWVLKIHISWMKVPAPLALFLRCFDVTFMDFMRLVQQIIPEWSKYKSVWRRLQEQLCSNLPRNKALYRFGKTYLRDTEHMSVDKCVTHTAAKLTGIFFSNLDPECSTETRMCHLVLCLSHLLRLAQGQPHPAFIDRDAIHNQECDDVGCTLANVLRQKLRSHVLKKVKSIRSAIYKHREQSLLHSDFDIHTVMEDKITNSLVMFVNTGTASEKRTGLTQLVCSVNYLSVVAHKRKTVSTLKGKEGNHKKSRRLDHHTFGVLCAPDTPDGQDVGLSFHRALCSNLSPVVDTDHVLYLLEHVVLRGAWIPQLLLATEKNQETSSSPHPVFSRILFGGVWVGCLDRRRLTLEEAVLRIRTAKRTLCLNPYVSAWVNRITAADQELCISARPGRYMLPFLHLHTALPTGDTTTSTDLASLQVIEYLDTQEIYHLPPRSIAIQPRDVFLYPSVTYLCLLDPLYLGPIALTMPFCNQDTGPRMTYYCQMVKQTMSLPTPIQAIDRYRLHYAERPVVTTALARHFGFDLKQPLQNLRVCIYSDPYAIEDAVVISRSAQRRLALYATSERIHQVEKSEKNKHKSTFKKPSQEQTVGLADKEDLSYMDDEGLPRVGTVLRKDERIIGCTTKTFFQGIYRSKHKDVYTPESQQWTKKHNAMELDHSQKMQDRVGRVIRVHKYPEVRKVITETTRMAEIGDKMSNQHAGKGVISRLREDHEMLIEERTNTRVDVYLCVEGFSSRLIAGLLRQLILGKAAALSGERFDDDHEYDEACREAQLRRAQAILKQFGWNENGEEYFIDPQTGERMLSPLMTGILPLQRLTHLVDKKHHARSTGVLNYLTRQPVTGRAKGGGQRNSYLQTYAAAAHGMSHYLFNRNVIHSDPNPFFAYCNQCGRRVLYNPQLKKGWCQACHSSQHIVARIAPFSLSLLQGVLAATGIRLSFKKHALSLLEDTQQITK